MIRSSSISIRSAKIPASLLWLVGGFSTLCAANAPIAFNDPLVAKLDWGTRALTVHDLNRDGLNDLILINNDQTQIQWLLQQKAGEGSASGKKALSNQRWDPVLEDATFDKQSITIGYPLFDLAVGDLNADGLPDLAYTSGNVPLSLRFQEAEGQWSEVKEFDDFEALGWPGTLKVSDLDGDGDLELVLLAADSFRVLGSPASARGDVLSRFFITGENPFNLILEDVNQDGLQDVLYLSTAGKQSLSLRLQLDSGEFGPEIRFPLERPYRTLTVLPKADPSEPPTFCAVDGRSGGLDFFQLNAEGGDPDNALQPEVFPLFQANRENPSYAVGDLDQNGTDDLLISNPAGAELYWFSGKAGGGFDAPKQYPTFTEVSSQALGNFFTDTGPTIVTLSSRESIIGLSAMTENGRVSFPKQIQLPEGYPLICEVLDWDHDGTDELAVLLDVDGQLEFVILSPLNRAQTDSVWTEQARLPLGDLKRAPLAMRQMDLFGQDALGLILFVAREAPIILRLNSTEASSITVCAEDSAIRQSFLKGVTPAQVTMADLDADGVSELVVGRDGYARSLKVGVDTIEMVDQFNTRQSTDSVTAILPQLELNGARYLGLYIGASGDLQLLQRESDGVYRYSRTEALGKIDLVASAARLSDAEGSDYLLFGKDRFWNLRTGGAVWSIQGMHSYETELEDVGYTQVAAADFNQDGATEILAVDGQNHVVELLQAEEASWKSVLYWEIFEQNMHYQGRKGGKLEPREMVIAELTGDDLDDFVFLIHDRILIYPQE